MSTTRRSFIRGLGGVLSALGIVIVVTLGGAETQDGSIMPNIVAALIGLTILVVGSALLTKSKA